MPKDKTEGKVKDRAVPVKTQGTVGRSVSSVKGFSLADTLKTVMDKVEETEVRAVTGKDAFTSEMVEAALEDFREENKEDNSVFLSLSSPAVRLSGETVELLYGNRFMYGLIKDYKTRVEGFLKEKLNNVNVQLKISISEDAEELHHDTGPVTTMEKLEYIENENPKVKELIARLSLEME